MSSVDLLYRCVDVREITLRSRDARQPGQDFLLNAVGKILVGFVFDLNSQRARLRSICAELRETISIFAARFLVSIFYGVSGLPISSE